MVYDFGIRLKELREKRSLSQAQVATRIGLTRASISSYESNTIVPSIEVLVKLALLYSVSTDYLLGIDDKTVIVLDGLTERQRNVIESVTSSIITEFKMTNLERPKKS